MVGKEELNAYSCTLEQVASELVRKANARGIPLCLFGGLAVRIACRGILNREQPLARPINDIDFASYSLHRRVLSTIFEESGMMPWNEFNILNASQHLKFTLLVERTEVRVDVVLDAVRMCHTIPLTGRLLVDKLCILPTDLLLTKLQIVELTERDAADLAAMFLAFRFTRGLREGDRDDVKVDYIGALCSKDWGLHRTVTGNLKRLCDVSGRLLTPSGQALLRKNCKTLATAIHQAPKSTIWRFRSLFGERIRWYKVPEEV